MRTLLLAIAISMLLAPTAFPQGTQIWGGTIAREQFEPFRGKFASNTAFSVSFQQRPLDDPLSDDTGKKGTISALAPHFMRWEYQSEPAQQVIIDGKRVWFVLPNDRQIYTELLAHTEYQAILNAFFGGKVAMDEWFTSKTELRATDGSYELHLASPASASHVQSLTCTWQKDSKWFTSLQFANKSGQRSELTFSDFKPSTELTSKLFEYSPPKGYQLLDFEGNLVPKGSLK